MVSLIIPWGLLLLLLITAILLIKKKWKVSVFLVIVIVIINDWSDCFCFGFKKAQTGDLKVLSFNVNGGEVCDLSKLASIISLIQNENPDIIFLAENFRPLSDSLYSLLHEQYPYDTRRLPHNVIYSKIQLHNPQLYNRLCGGSSFVVKCSATIKDKEVFIFGCHLSSNNYSKDLNYLTPGKVNSLSKFKSYFSNMSYAFEQRKMEVDSIISYCPEAGRVIVLGDMNDVCGAPSMRKFYGAGFKDAWSESGFGYGATIHHPLPYRIDHILYNKGLKLRGIKKIDAEGISDHDALVAVFEIE